MNDWSIKNKLLVAGTVLMTCIYIAWRIFFTIPLHDGIVSLIAAMTLLLVEITGMFEMGVHFFNMTKLEYPKRPKLEDEDYPDIDVFIATYNEPVALLYKTVNGCVNMDYPDKRKVHIYLCDDSNRPEMQELARQMNVNYLSRSDRRHAKAGNLNNALKHSNSPLVVTLDADMIPMHDFLVSCVPYFFTGEKVGFVQTPQSFYNTDLFQFNLYSENRIPNEQDYFYRDVQVSRNKSNSVIYGGTNTILARQALMDIGGFYTGVITEDFATGIEIQSKGYKCYAISEVFVSGLAPTDLRSLVKQRQRWARGCIQTGKRINLLAKKGLSAAQKLNYISSITYWYFGLKRIVYILSPLLYAVFNVMVVKCNIMEVLIFWLPMYLLTNLSLRMLSGNMRTTKWTNVYETILFQVLTLSVLLETFGISQKTFAVTQKDRTQGDKRYQLLMTIPHGVLAVLSVIGIVNCVRLTFESGSISYVVVLYWVLVNFYNIMMSIFFMIGRKAFRSHERFYAKVDCVIAGPDQIVECITSDISEGGLSVTLQKPVFLPYQMPLDLELYTDRNRSKFKARIVHVDQTSSGWKYAFTITSLEEEQYKELLQIIYDRVPTLPQKLDKDISTFDDIRINVVRRGKQDFVPNRKLVRITLERVVATMECGNVTLADFNYEFVLIRIPEKGLFPPALTLQLEEDLTLACTFVQSVSGKNAILYRISERDAFSQNGKLEALLLRWHQDYVSEQQKQLEKRRHSQRNEFNEMSFI